ncbi:MAG: zinc ribbon domain-containing protein [Bacillota bacterium]
MSDMTMLWDVQELLQRRKTLTKEINSLPIIAQYKDERALYDRMREAQQGLADRLATDPDDNALREQYDDLQGRLMRQRQTVLMLQEEGRSQYDTLTAELNSIPERIDRIKQKVRPELWRKFERLMDEKQGRAVAKVRKRHCLGCGVGLSDAALSRLRAASTSVVECEHCGRLLIWE